jgi:VWFA-related protein
MRWFSLFRLVLVLSLALTTFSAATTEAAGLTLDVRSVDASQFPKVTTTVSLVDSLDVPLANLDRSALTLKEDDSTIQDVQIQPTIDPQQALAVALLVDTGSSMNDAGKLAAAKQALGAFVDALGPQDSAAVIAFSDQPKVVQGYTGDKNALKAAVNQLQAGGPHAIFDAVTQASQFQAALSQKRKVLLLLTDSGDTASKQTLDSASSAARNAHVPVYAVGLGSDVHHDLLDILAGQTAGQVTYVASADGLAKAFQDEATHFRRLYQLTYTSKLAGDDKSHTLTVTVKTQAQELTPQGTWQSHLETPSGQGSFTAKSNALDFDVAGIKTATQVSGTNPITVTLKSGQASQMQLLVDGQQRASLTAAPYAFPWDTTKETPGIHRVVIRAIGADGKPTDSEFIVQVLAPASAAPTTAPATTVAAVPTVAPAPVPAPPPPNLLL